MMGKEAAYILKVILIFFLYWLGIPFALKQAGFGMGIFLLIFTALVNGKIFEYNPQRFFFLPSEGAWTFSFLVILLMGSKTWHFVYSRYISLVHVHSESTSMLLQCTCTLTMQKLNSFHSLTCWGSFIDLQCLINL